MLPHHLLWTSFTTSLLHTKTRPALMCAIKSLDSLAHVRKMPDIMSKYNVRNSFIQERANCVVRCVFAQSKIKTTKSKKCTNYNANICGGAICVANLEVYLRIRRLLLWMMLVNFGHTLCAIVSSVNWQFVLLRLHFIYVHLENKFVVKQMSIDQNPPRQRRARALSHLVC